jgi:hypothetical protein
MEKKTTQKVVKNTTTFQEGDKVKIPWISYFEKGGDINKYLSEGKFSIMEIESINDGFCTGHIIDSNGDTDSEDGEEVYEVSLNNLREV